MNPIKFRHIIIGFVVAFILFLFYRLREDGYSYDHVGTHNTGPSQSQPSYSSFDCEQTFASSSTGFHNPTTSNRHEVLQTKVRGYRKETYWGEQHPTYEKARHMSNDEFSDFVEENVELKDADIYWGAEY